MKNSGKVFVSKLTFFFSHSQMGNPNPNTMPRRKSSKKSRKKKNTRSAKRWTRSHTKAAGVSPGHLNMAYYLHKKHADSQLRTNPDPYVASTRRRR